MSLPNPVQTKPLPPKIDTHFNPVGYRGLIESRMTIIDKNKREVPFLLNDAQRDFLPRLGDYLNLIVLKARKMGFSSVILGIGAVKFLTGTNERVVSMSFDSGASQRQLERAKHFLASYERFVQQTNSRFKLPLKYNSKTELTLESIDEDGRPFQNTMRVGTAKSNSFGRGDDITFLHLTEVSLADHLEDLLAGVSEAVVADAHTVLETTANGYNEFKALWDAAVLGERDYLALFYSPEWEYGLEHLEGRRKKLGRLYTQEYPPTPQDAFIASGDLYFEREALRWYLQRVQRAQTI